MFLKRIFDVVLAIVSLTIGWPFIIIIWLMAGVDTNSNGIFIQNRVGQFGKQFKIFKFRTLHLNTNKISKVGAFFRKYKLDETPQLINILIGNMSFVGPRPDLPGYYDALKGENIKILQLKPGLISEAALKYANEEDLLAKQTNPLKYNDEVLFPEKVHLNLNYYYNQSFWGDIKLICKSIKEVLLNPHL